MTAREIGEHASIGTRRLAGGTWRTLAVIAGAIVVGLGVPALWFWIGGRLGGDYTPGYHLSAQTFAAIIPGMLITYVLVLDLASWLYSRTMSEKDRREQGWPVRRAAWNRSMRDARYRPGESKLNPVEVTFVLTATIASLAFTAWFFLYAKSPI